jgi:hypothetical protein
MTENCARIKSEEEYLDYGCCIHDGKWYVGTKEELEKIDVIIGPTPED